LYCRAIASASDDEAGSAALRRRFSARPAGRKGYSDCARQDAAHHARPL